MKNTRKGFTLVELLIVIVVIGILSAMMMLSSTEATTSAKVAAIVSNMRNIKTATLAYYTDNMDTYANSTAVPSLSDILPYINGENIPELTKTNPSYSIKKNTTSGNADEGKWYVVYNITQGGNSTAEQAKIRQKLAGRAGALGLTQGVSSTKYAGGASDNEVGMHIR